MTLTVDENFKFSKIDHAILDLWKEKNIFAKSLDKNKDKPLWTFLDGPPFINGSMHSGHVLVSYVKDTVIRYKSMNGYSIPRTIGYDCHGLPLEQAAEKELNMTTKEAIESLGIGGYNDKCREIINKCTNIWEEGFWRMGRWVDVSKKYKTMDTPYMETEWWAFKELFKKGLVYRGLKIMPYSPKCTTTLSNFEANQNYRDVIDQSIIVKFPLVDLHNTSFLVWTTTPYTIPSNQAICVNAKLEYCKVHDCKNDEYFILAKNLYKSVFKNMFPQHADHKIVETFLGATLKNIEYMPIFNMSQNTTYKVLLDDFVKEDSGTGCVHLAPGFGADDFRVCLANNIIDKYGNNIVLPIDETASYTSQIINDTDLKEFQNKFVLDCNRDLIRMIKEHKKRLFGQFPYTHSYPHCYRTDTPLIYKAVSAWFINVEKIGGDILDNTKEKTTWMPQHVKDGRFVSWLENVQDWCVSRTRCWGTSIPLWVSDDGEEIVCIGSIEELETLANLPTRSVTDLHREHVDHIEIPSNRGKGTLKRIPEIFDCWYESGLCGIASHHYPFENKEYVEEHYPVDFITESIDQTRGWFYTLMVLSSALFNKAAFKNVIVTGLILADDGQKMSKRLQNYTDPMKLIDQYGSDSMRLYLINSPAVRAEPFAFKNEGLVNILKKLLLWYNVYKFFMESCVYYQQNHCKHTNSDYQFTFAGFGNFTENVLDIWIMKELDKLVEDIANDMKNLKLSSVVPRLLNFIENLSIWYVRLNRDRIKGKYNVKNRTDNIENWEESLKTLFDVLIKFNIVMAPFCPFFTEYMYQNLKKFLPSDERNAYSAKESIHLYDYPKSMESVDENILRQMHRVQVVIEKVRAMKHHKNIPMAKYLEKITICTSDYEIDDDLTKLSKYIKAELSAINLVFDELNKYVTIKVVTNLRNIGRKFKKDTKRVIELLESTSIYVLENDKIEYNNIEITNEFYTLETERTDDKIDSDSNTLYMKHYSTLEYMGDSGIMIIIDTTQTPDVISLNIVQEFRRSVQQLRKDAELQPWTKIRIYYDTHDKKLIEYLKKHKKLLKKQLIYDVICMKDTNEFVNTLTFKEKNKDKMIIEKGTVDTVHIILLAE
jgi:isoleucyl-tRNA synthetase